MTRKHVIVTISLLIGVAAGVAGTLWSLFQAPAFYSTALRQDVPPDVRKEQAKRFVQSTLQLVNEIKNDDRWSEEFSEEQVNCWLAEELHQQYSEWLPEGVKEPRVQFGKDTLALAFQFDRGFWTGVVSGKLKLWVSGPNRLAIEIQSVKAGLIPIPLDNVLEELSKELKNVGWHVQSTRSQNDSDILIVHFSRENDDTEQSILEVVQLRPQVLRISGKRKTHPAVAALRAGVAARRATTR